MSKSGLIKVRSMAPVSRRGFNAGLLAAAGLAATGIGMRSARAGDVVFLGWQGYDEALYVGDFMDNEGISLATTYIGNNDEIVTKLRAGGVGTVDIVTPYMGYVPLLAPSIPMMIPSGSRRRRLSTPSRRSRMTARTPPSRTGSRSGSASRRHDRSLFRGVARVSKATPRTT